MTDSLTQTCTGVERHPLMHISPSASDTFQDVFVTMTKDTIIIGTFNVLFLSFLKYLFGSFLVVLPDHFSIKLRGGGGHCLFLIDGR